MRSSLQFFARIAALSAVPLLATCQDVCGCTYPMDTFEAALSGDRVVPPVTTIASGSGRFHLLGGWSEMEYQLTVTNVSGPATARLHAGVNGSNGPAMLTLCSPCTTNGTRVLVSDTVAVDAGLVNTIRAFGIYLEITTPSGPVLRGPLRLTVD